MITDALISQSAVSHPLVIPNKTFLLNKSKVFINDKLFSPPLCQDMSHILYP